MRGLKKNEEGQHTSHHGEKSSSKGFPKILTLIIVIIMACMIANYLLFRVALLQHEYSKVGGKQNYDILSNLQMQQINSVLQYYKSNPETLTNQLTNNEATVATTSQLDGVSLGSMQEGYAKLGDENADLIFVEYSDLECPYCKQQNEVKAYDTLNQKYPGKIAYMFKHFPLNIHPGSEKKHEALECIKKLVGDNAYFTMKDKIFSENSYQSPINFEAVETMAVELGASQDEFSTCVNSGEFTKKVQDSTNEGKNYFGVSATPSTIIINKKTGEFRVFSGVQQESTLESTVQELLGK